MHGPEDAVPGGLLHAAAAAAAEDRSTCLVSCGATAEARAADTAGDCAGSRVKVTGNSALQPPVN